MDLEQNSIHKVARAPREYRARARTLLRTAPAIQGRFSGLMRLLPPDFRQDLMFFRRDGFQKLVTIQAGLKKRTRLKHLMGPDVERGLLATGFFDFDAYTFAARLTMPILVVAGAHDSELSVDNSERFSVVVPDGNFVRLEASGHSPFLEQPRRLTAAMLRFFRENEV